MRVYSYVIEHDLGFAPNPFHGVCSLACCKPQIRKTAERGDYILGLGAAKPKLTGHLCYWMKVDEILKFDQYWGDPRFKRKRPVMGGTTFLQYGDNIYHRDGGKTFLQEDSFHSKPNGRLSVPNRRRDTGTTDKILLSRTFAYWGKAGIKLPPELKYLVTIRGHKCRFSDSQIATFLEWLKTHPERGYLGEPAHWQFAKPPKSKK